MALRALLHNSLLLVLSVRACLHGALPKADLNSGDPHIFTRNGLVYRENKLFNGRIFTLARNGRDTLYSCTFRDGKEDGEQRIRYENGQLASLRKFEAGYKTGTHTGYWGNGNPKFVYHFRSDLYEGEQFEWYPDGKVFSRKNYVAGHENGPQKNWDESGKLKANYEARNGRNYGYIGKKSCASIWKNGWKVRPVAF